MPVGPMHSSCFLLKQTYTTLQRQNIHWNVYFQFVLYFVLPVFITFSLFTGTCEECLSHASETLFGSFLILSNFLPFCFVYCTVGDYEIRCKGEDFLMVRNMDLTCRGKTKQACYTRSKCLGYSIILKPALRHFLFCALHQACLLFTLDFRLYCSLLFMSSLALGQKHLLNVMHATGTKHSSLTASFRAVSRCSQAL